MEELNLENKQQLLYLLAKASVFCRNLPQLQTISESQFQSQDAQKALVVFNKVQEEFQSFLTELSNAKSSESSEATHGADPSRVYIDGCWDIMHSGHFNAIRQAKMLAKTLVVGIHSDEEITRNKGPPVMSMHERVAMLRACKWVDEIVENAPYSPNIELLDRLNCLYIAHGDDIAINCDGHDAYSEIKNAGRFKIIKRTEGVSTTTLVGKLILMNKDHLASFPEPMVINEVKSNFLATSRRITEFSNKTRKPKGSVVYVDGSFDLFHIGHIETLKKAKSLGNFLIVGIHDDQTVNEHKGSNFPIMNLHERVLNVLACKYVDEVVIGAPWIITEDLIKSLNISYVVQGSVSKLDPSVSEFRKLSLGSVSDSDPFGVPKKLGIFREVVSEREIETSHIIQRIIDNRLTHLNKYMRKSVSEQNYYDQEKEFVEEI